MNVERGRFKNIGGFIRALEVTYRADKRISPSFACLMLMKYDYWDFKIVDGKRKRIPFKSVLIL